jgi:hypothetical protein
VIDAEDRCFREDPVQRRVELLRRAQVATEWLLDDHPRILRAAGVCESLNDAREHAGWNREIVNRACRRAERLAELAKGFRVFIVAIDITQQRREFRELAGVEPARLREAVARPVAQLLEIPAGAGHADDGNRDAAAIHQGVERRENLLESKIAGRAEEDEGVGCGGVGCGGVGCGGGHERPPRSRRSCLSSSSS